MKEAQFPEPYGHREFKAPKSVLIENLGRGGAVVQVVDGKGWSHTFYTWSNSGIDERKDLRRRTKPQKR